MQFNKKNLLILCVFLTVYLSGTAFASTVAKHTLLIYLNGSDLESREQIHAATDNLNEMKLANTSAAVNLLIETCGTKKWQTAGISDRDNQYWQIKNGEMSLKKNVGNRGIADPKDLQQFIEWGITNFPAEKYSLILFDHGGGPVFGFGCDELHDNQSLPLSGVGTAVSAAVRTTGKKLELIGFDACVMAGVETAAILKSNANYLVASEELVPGHGWDYQAIFEKLSADSDMSGIELGKVICNSFYKKAQEAQTAPVVTMSVVDLNRITAVLANLKDIPGYSDGLKSVTAKQLKQIAGARARSESYAPDYPHMAGLADLYDFAAKLKERYAVDTAGLQTAVREAVVYNIHGQARNDSHGLSVFLFDRTMGDQPEIIRHYTENSGNPKYNKFVTVYAEKMFSGKANEIIGEVVLVDNVPRKGTDGSYSVQIRPEDFDIVSEATLLLGYRNPEDQKLFLLGMDNIVAVDEKNATIKAQFSEKTLAIGECPVSIYWNGQTDEETIDGVIPIIWNDRQAGLLVVKNKLANNVLPVGVLYGTNQETNMPDRDARLPQTGDRIRPLYWQIDEKTGQQEYVQGEEFVLKEPLKINEIPLSAGQYQLAFYINDIIDRGTATEYLNVEIK